MQSKGFIYHIVPPAIWEKALMDGRYQAPGYATEGFIHCSTKEQVLESARIHLGEHEELVVLRLILRWIKDKVKWEEGRNGELFPHLYAHLQMHEVETTLMIERQADGSFAWED